jgi:pimeloyl-ACP methyl ester carboxylesterase
MPQLDAQAPTLLYLHGTFRNLQGNQHKIASLYAAGFSVLAVDYRGWGQSTVIVPSEKTILQDARIAWQELVRREPMPGKRVIYGHSMGSGVAVDLASQLPYPASYGGLILESAFTSFAGIAHQAGFWASLLQAFSPERFASIDKIAQVRAPLLMIHGDLDDTIPIQLGEQLFAAANPPKQWLSISGGHHSDLDKVGEAPYQQALHMFMTKILAASRASQRAATDAPALQAQ